MNFEEHFMKQDVTLAESAFKNVIGSLELILIYNRQGKFADAKRATTSLLISLNDLDKLASRKTYSERMHLHNLLIHPQSWYPRHE